MRLNRGRFAHRAVRAWWITSLAPPSLAFPVYLAADRRVQREYPNVATAAQIEALFAGRRAVDLYYDVVKPGSEWPTLDFLIKSIAKICGFTWRDSDPSGAASIDKNSGTVVEPLAERARRSEGTESPSNGSTRGRRRGMLAYGRDCSTTTRMTVGRCGW
jgi:hypothetical protein